MHHVGPEMGGGGGGGWAFALTFMKFVVVNVHGVFSTPFAHNLDAKTVEL